MEYEETQSSASDEVEDEKRIAQILNNTHSGDIVLMNRKCLNMKHKLAKSLCLLHKIENRFDHAAMIVKIPQEELTRHTNIAKTVQKCAHNNSPTSTAMKLSSYWNENSIYSPSNTYILETNVNGVTLRPAERRISCSSANEIVIRSITMKTEEEQMVQQSMLDEVNKIVSVPYETNLLNIIPSFFTPPDKLDRINAAHKLNALEHAIQTSHALYKQYPEESTTVNRWRACFESAKRFLISTYFPHLDLFIDRETGIVHLDVSRGHFVIDGRNDAKEMVCSELICNIWQRTKLTTGYVPASGIRPFDFFDNTRFNFTHAGTHWSELQTCRSSQ